MNPTKSYTTSGISISDPISQTSPFGIGSGITRRNFVKSGISALALPLCGGCVKSATDVDTTESSARISARPGLPTETPTLGLSELGFGEDRDGIMYVPENYSPDSEYPLFIGLHGASGDADNWNGSYPDRAEQRGMVFLAPDSRFYTWDLITGRQDFGPDVEFINQMLEYAFARCRIDPTRIALGGFSDGATYALSLGVGNGDLFSHIVAYSPGYMVEPDPLVGSPRVFVSHGPADAVLSFDITRDRIVPQLEDLGLDVTFHEFQGGHEVPAEVSTTALDWFLGAG